MSTEDATTLLYYNYQNIVYNRGCKFIETGETVKQVKQMASTLTGDSNKFGIFLCGTCGNGKTTLLRAFQTAMTYLDRQNAFYEDMQREHQRYDALFYDAKTLARIAKSDEEWNRLVSSKVVIIDDCGTEPAEVVDYGNILNPLADLIEHRYARQSFTIISTNLTPEEFSNKYGKRVADRMTEMMDKIIFKNESFRRNNMDRKTIDEVAFSGRLKGSIATITVIDRKNVIPISTMLGTQPADVEIEYMIVKVSVGLLGRTLTKNEEMLLVKEMKKLISEYDSIQNCRKDKTISEE